MSLIIDKLSKRYENTWALRDVAFEAAPGEITGIFGVSGSGKTSLLRLIEGTEQNNGGALRHNDADITALNAADRGFTVIQTAAKPSWKGIFGGQEKSSTPDGELRTQAISDAISRAKAVLLLDNPFAGLDRGRCERVYSGLKASVKEKLLTAVITTSDFLEAMVVCDRIVVLEKGEVLQTGTPSEIYLEPATSRVAALCGRNNLIEARRLTSTKIENPEFQTIKGEHRLFTSKTDKSRFAPINQNNILTIRPEHISISFGASFPEDNLLKAKITEVHFQGPTTRVVLDANGLRLEALVLRLVGLNIGEECVVGLPPDRILVFKN